MPAVQLGLDGSKKPIPQHKNDLKNSPHYVSDPHATVVKKPPEFGGGYSAFTGGPERAVTRFSMSR